MNGTIGTIAKIAHASLAPVPISSRVRRSIQISTTAIGCKKQIRSSIIFFTVANVPLLGLRYLRAARLEAAGTGTCRSRSAVLAAQ